MADTTTTTPIKCACGKQIGTMTTPTPPHPLVIPTVLCPLCAEKKGLR